ncbi:MAG: hypothetical protein BGP16_13310 [Sphingobium sp. 66-54]|nr:MAG: hypothetical protein BGP16_13310 [Sphingobium sp. 66-54]
MDNDQNARQQFVRMMKWITLAAVLVVIAALVFLGRMGSLTAHTAFATILGVFFSVTLGCGLFALAFFSDKSGHDDTVDNATRHHDGI